MTSQDKQGFAPLSENQLRAEARGPLEHDFHTPGHSVSFYADNTYGIRPPILSFGVEEHSRLRPGTDNSSIQSVEYTTRDGGIASVATADQSSLFNMTETRLFGYADGRVVLETPGNTPRDITEAAAKAGITAADIRNMQLTIAADGEVDRPEQQTIIDLINRIKNLPSR